MKKLQSTWYNMAIVLTAIAVVAGAALGYVNSITAPTIEALKAQNQSLQTQVNLQALAASQTAQTAQLIADNTAQTQYIVNRVAPYPIPAYTVANPVTPAI